MTSRPQSAYEVDGESCWFISHEEILAGIDRDEFLEMRDNLNPEYIPILIP